MAVDSYLRKYRDNVVFLSSILYFLFDNLQEMSYNCLNMNNYPPEAQNILKYAL